MFWALPTLIVALTRRCVTSTFAVIPLALNAFTTPLRFADEAPYLLASVESDGYLPYDDDDGSLAALTAPCRPDWFAIRPSWSESLRLVDAAPTDLSPAWEI